MCVTLAERRSCHSKVGADHFWKFLSLLAAALCSFNSNTIGLPFSSEISDPIHSVHSTRQLESRDALSCCAVGNFERNQHREKALRSPHEERLELSFMSPSPSSHR